ncbi:FAD-dependent oxidoreductase [Chloroflexota bacterium]
MDSYEELFKPGRIGGMELSNRLVMPAMLMAYGSGGYVTERTKRYYEERARGGVGLVIVEDITVEAPRGWWRDEVLRVDEEKFVPGLSELTGVIHRHGAKAAIQLYHPGAEGAVRSEFTGCQPAAPSPVSLLGQEVPHELTVAKIGELVAGFARAAERVKRAGFDAIEIHGAHGYLIAQFLMPATNKRQDRYGGDIAGRARFLLEIVEAVRGAVGPDFSFWCRLNGREAGTMGTFPLEELQWLVLKLQQGGVRALHISGRPPFHNYFVPSGYYVETVASVKKMVNIPVIACGGITPKIGESVLKQGKADFIAFGRPLIADPQIPSKLAAGKAEDIAPCIRCMECANTLLNKKQPTNCAVNASLGKEREYQIKPAGKKKRVLVVGGGPGGLETARVAALRGHQVMLYEKNNALGGQMLAAAQAPHKVLIEALTDYLVRQVEKSGVQIELGKTIDSRLAGQLKPDAVVLATGGLPIIPEIPGINRASVVTAEDALLGRVKLGRKAIVIGGGLVGCETALWLVSRGKSVVLLELMPEIASEVIPLVRDDLLQAIKTVKDLTIYTGVTCEEITPEGAILHTGQGDRETIAADTIILATGRTANNELAVKLRGKVHQVYLVGDCREPGNILGAIRDGSRIAHLML